MRVGRTVDGEKLAAMRALLAREDERALRGRRGHRVTQTGTGNRMAASWLPAASVWVARRLQGTGCEINGWKPAQRVRPLGAVLRMR